MIASLPVGVRHEVAGDLNAAGACVAVRLRQGMERRINDKELRIVPDRSCPRG
jgi:hypothetical protein